MVRHVAQRALACTLAERVVLATDDARIAAAVEGLAIEVMIETTPFRSGSDRVAAVASQLGCADDDVVIDLQGDEPLITAEALRGAVRALERGELGTVAVSAGVAAVVDDPNSVKVRHDGAGRALDFLRRIPEVEPDLDRYAVHLGVYAYTAATLSRFAALPSGRREQDEGLEQLRALERGWSIGLTLVDAPLASIDIAQDAERVAQMIDAATGTPPRSFRG